MAKLVWRVKLIAELGSGIVSETEVARIERDDFAVAETVGLTPDEGKRPAAAAQPEIVRAQVTAMGERFRWCEHCRAKLVSKGYYPATFRSVFGDVAVRVRRLGACRCRAGMREPKSFSALAATDGIAPKLAYITATFAALAPFARVEVYLFRGDVNQHKAEPNSDPAWLHCRQPLSFDDQLSIATRSFGWGARLRSRITRIGSTARATRQWRRSIAALEALDDHILKDIGVHRSQIGSFASPDHLFD
jgi:uncharacterized protein YjiS (DUF1127 family)